MKKTGLFLKTHIVKKQNKFDIVKTTKCNNWLLYCNFIFKNLLNYYLDKLYFIKLTLFFLVVETGAVN